MRQSSFFMVAKRFCRHRLAVACLVILLGLILLAVFAPWIAPYGPTKISGGFSKPPDAEHWLGTDQIGRDMFSRLLYAMRVSLLVGFLATVISTAIGVVLGLVSGYFGGWVDRVIMSFTDMVMSFPYILLVLVAAAIFEPGMWTMIIILGLVDWPGVARLVRGNVLSLSRIHILRKAPGIFIRVGTGGGYPGHHPKFTVDPAALEPAARYFAALAQACLAACGDQK